MSTLSVETRELTFGQAINEALAEEMRRDERVFVIGEDVAEAGTPFKVLSGLVEEFGPARVLDSPISEAGITGLGVGAAMTGLRPVVDIMFGDFLTLVMDQLVNQAAKVHYMSGGKLKVPLVVRTTLGATRRSAAQHSQSLQAWVSHIPGLKVAIPSTPSDAKGLLKTAIRDDNPVVFIEDKLHYQLKGEVPAGEYTIPLGVADVKRPGDDVTIVATSSMVQASLAAAELLESDGGSARSTFRCRSRRRSRTSRSRRRRRSRTPRASSSERADRNGTPHVRNDGGRLGDARRLRAPTQRTAGAREGGAEEVGARLAALLRHGQHPLHHRDAHRHVGDG